MMSTTLNQTEIAARHHRRATRWFWFVLIRATLVSIVGNIVHALLPYIPTVAIQIGVATVPPIGLLVAVHSIAHLVRGGASGRVYHWAVGAVVIVGTAAFAVSFIALRDLMVRIGYSPRIAGLFPVTIDCMVGVATVALVALGDKPARRTRTITASASTQAPTMGPLVQPPTQKAKAQIAATSASARIQTVQAERVQSFASAQRDPAQTVQGSAQTEATQVDAEIAHVHADLASELIASGVTTQPIETVIAVLAASRGGASINAAAKASGINYRTAQRIVEAAAERRQRQLLAVG
jgi:Protein of unknown function (DUF2637)